ncbi:MAG: N-acetyltransferase [Bacteroidetes bacterium]|nr:N-acetyltransferase [Bacteroidota bacterium]
MKSFFATSAVIERNVSIGEETKIWYFSHIREGAKLGKECNVGDYCFIGENVIIGDDVRLGNGCQLYDGLIIKDHVRIGNNVSFTNVRKPSAKHKGKHLDTIVEEYVTIGANCTIVGGIKIGQSAQIADGSVVFFDVPDGVFVAGNPGRIKKQIYENN